MDIGQEPLGSQVEKLLSGEIVLPDIQRDFVWSGPPDPGVRTASTTNGRSASISWTTSPIFREARARRAGKLSVGVQPSDHLDGQPRLTTTRRGRSHPTGRERVRAASKSGFIPVEGVQNASAVSRKIRSWIRAAEILPTVLSSASSWPDEAAPGSRGLNG